MAQLNLQGTLLIQTIVVNRNIHLDELSAEQKLLQANGHGWQQSSYMVQNEQNSGAVDH